jgi:hypothetical protein
MMEDFEFFTELKSTDVAVTGRLTVETVEANGVILNVNAYQLLERREIIKLRDWLNEAIDILDDSPYAKFKRLPIGTVYRNVSDSGWMVKVSDRQYFWNETGMLYSAIPDMNDFTVDEK